MRLSVLFPGTLALCAVLNAQPFTIPPGFTTTHNPSSAPLSYSYTMGSYADERFQVISGDWTGKGAKLMLKLGLRRDANYYYTPVGTQGVQRTWSNVSLDVGDSSFSAASTTFANNFTGTPTRVFNAAMSWADTSAVPPAPPAFGSNGMTFPFNNPVVYNATKDICFEFNFTGGKLKNGATWSGGTGNWVLLDGYSVSNYAGPLYNYLYNANCIPTGQARWGYFRSYIYTYGPGHAQANKFGVNHNLAYSAKSTAHVAALGLQGVAAGINIGTCQKLYMTQFLAYLYFTSSTTGTYSVPTYYFPFTQAAVGVTLWGQAAYTDPGTKAFELTAAGRATVPAMPPTIKAKVQRIYNYNPSSLTGFKGQTYVPILGLN